MIESHYWRSELRADLAWLRQHRKYRRWSEKQHVLFERKLMLVAFQVRSLLERPKVNDIARQATTPAIRYRKLSGKPFTVVGADWPHDRFDMENPEATTLSILNVCNQLIHYYWMQTLTETRTFVTMLVFSDYERHKWAYQIQIQDLIQLFQVFAENSSALTGAQFEWSEKKQDFVVTPHGPKGASPGQ